MAGLKTLKDFDEERTCRDCCWTYHRNELRQEAIKDIKEFREQREGKREWNFLPPHFDKEAYEAIELYIMWKNNITEEELCKKSNEQEG